MNSPSTTGAAEPLALAQAPADLAEHLLFAQQKDPLGHKVHLALAVTYFLTLALKTSPNGVAFGLLVAIAVVRLPHTCRCYRLLARERLIWLLFAWAGWSVLSLYWSNNPQQGIDELGSARVILVPLIVWPVINHAAAMIAALLIGVFVQNVVQLGQGLDLIGRPENDGERLRGLIHPIQTGALCAAAMCWHLSAALHGKKWFRWVSLLGLFVAGCGLVFTGSRGPWLSATFAVPLALIIIAARRPQLRRRALQVTVLAAIGAIVLIPLTWNVICNRYEQAMHEMQKAETGRLNTDVGFRLASWSTAWQLFLDAPIQGMGAGGYKEPARQGPHRKALRKASHAHSVYMHVLACSGAVGSAIFAAIIALMLWRSVRGPVFNVYSDANVFVLLTWLIGAAFDAYHLNGLLFGLFAALLTFALASPHLRVTQTLATNNDSRT